MFSPIVIKKVKSEDIVQYVWDSREEHYDSHLALRFIMATITPQVNEFPAKKWVQKGDSHGGVSIKEVKGQSVSYCTFFIVKNNFEREQCVQHIETESRRLDLECQAQIDNNINNNNNNNNNIPRLSIYIQSSF